MIENLHGTHETVNFKQSSRFVLYNNDEYESYPSHWHSEIEIIMPTVNNYVAHVNGKEFLVEVDDILIINSGVLHYLPAREGKRFIFQTGLSPFHLVPDLDSILSIIPPAMHISPANNPAIYNQVHAFMSQIIDEHNKSISLMDAVIYSQLIQMIVVIGREISQNAVQNIDVTDSKHKEYTEKFMTVCSYIGDHFAEDITLEEIAELAGFSKFHFSRLFKNFTGVTFYRYLNQKRINNAEKFLINPSISITETALRSGFNNLSTFIRMFKQFKGCTPTEFRSLYNGKSLD